MNKSVNDGGDCRTAPATPGLLNIVYYTSIYEALLDKVYIRMPPGVNFGISLKRPETTQMGYFWSSRDSKSQDLTKINLEHHISRITPQTVYVAYEF